MTIEYIIHHVKQKKYEEEIKIENGVVLAYYLQMFLCWKLLMSQMQI